MASSVVVSCAKDSAQVPLRFLAQLVEVLSVIDLEIVCDSNTLPNHLIDGWEGGCQDCWMWIFHDSETVFSKLIRLN